MAIDKNKLTEYATKWIAAQTIASEFWDYIKQDLIQMCYEARAKELREGIKNHVVKESTVKQKLQLLKESVQRDFSNYDLRTKEIVKQFDHIPNMNEIVQVIQDELEKIKVV